VNLRQQAAALATRASTEAHSAVSLLRAGALGVDPPRIWLRALAAFRANGPAGAALSVAAQRHRDRPALIDELGWLSFTELDGRSSSIANALRERGFRDGDCVGVLCRNHRGMFDALFAGAKLGARTLLLNTDFAGPQLADVCERESVALLIHDQEFAAIVSNYEPRLGRVLAWTDASDSAADTTLESLVATGDPALPPRPTHMQQIVLLTSGTTGTPKGAPREFGTSLAIPGGYLEKIPYRSRRTVCIAAPVFHAWGLLSSIIALALGNTLVMERRVDPLRTLDALAEYPCDALVTVPILLSRMLAVGDDEIRRRRLADLRIVAVSGSALSAELATRTMDLLGDKVYNLYGSTEVAYATIATPEDLRAAPGCVGRPPHGTTIKLLDESGAEVSPGKTGRIFVGNSIHFAGYTGGGSKEQVAGLMSTGDVGHFDDGGRLFVDGRDDDMIISGGENVFPAEIENLLTAHVGIAEAAVIGVPDPEFGQRLRAYLVPASGASIDADMVQQYVKANLARYKVPRDVVFIDAMPRNPAGKIVKRQLPTA
jgi:fatty-acyl-CoA synthase